MAKNKVFICENCQHEHAAYNNKCNNCGEMFSLIEHESDGDKNLSSSAGKRTSSAGLKTSGAMAPTTSAKSIKDLKSTPIRRIPTGINELDRVIGGGFVDAQVVLLASVPGAGKSTISIKLAEKIAQQGKTVLYSSGEESEHQIGLRANRMGIDEDNILITNETRLETVLGHIEAVKPDFVIVDSLQTLASNDINGSMGSVSQSKEAANVLTRIAKSQGIMMLLISQIVKSGDFSGSESIQHIVDTTMMMENDSESPLRFLRAIKNRFGDTDEVGVFQHESTGLEEVPDPSGIFTEDAQPLAGSAITMMTEGIRAIPVEVQALTSKTTASFPRRQFSGVDYNRAQIICAVVDKYCKVKISDDDVYLSTLGGVKLQDPLTDLGIAAAIVSSSRDRVPSADRVAFVGEVSLTGYITGGTMMESRIREADRLGFDEIVVPTKAKSRTQSLVKNVTIVGISHIRELKDFMNKESD